RRPRRHIRRPGSGCSSDSPRPAVPLASVATTWPRCWARSGRYSMSLARWGVELLTDRPFLVTPILWREGASAKPFLPDSGGAVRLPSFAPNSWGRLRWGMGGQGKRRIRLGVVHAVGTARREKVLLSQQAI